MKRIGTPGFVASVLIAPRAFTLALLLLASFVMSGHADGDAPDAGTTAGYTPRPSTQGSPRTLHIAARAGARVLRIPISGTIDLGLTALVRRALAQDSDAVAVVLDINTLGGRVDAAIQIRDALLESKLKTIAFVHPRAISAGALISLACDFIAISNGGSIGAATPIQLGEGGSAQPVEEKMVSYFRTEMRSTAEAKGRRGDVAEAMVDASVVIPGLDQADKLLTLDTEGALSVGIADFRAENVSEVLAKLGLEQAPRSDVIENWAEVLVRFLTDPVVSGLLMSLGTLGILIELYAPGHAIPGVLGVLSLALFFGGHLLVHLAGLEEFLLLCAGFILLMFEVFVIPGFGVAGITGIVCIFAALLLTLIGLPLSVVFSTSAWIEPLTRVSAALTVTIVGMFLAIRILPGTRAGKRLVLSSANTRRDGFVASDESRFVGKLGVAESDLRPVGVARFGDERVDVVTQGEYVHSGQTLEVVQVEGARIVVRVLVDRNAKSQSSV